MGITGRRSAARRVVHPRCYRKLSSRLDRTNRRLAPGPRTTERLDSMAYVVNRHHSSRHTYWDDMIGPAECCPRTRKQTVKYYANSDAAREAYLRCEFPIEYGRSPLHAYTATLRGGSAALMPLHIKHPRSHLEAEDTRRHLDQYNTQLMTATTEIFDRSVRALAMPAAPPRPMRDPPTRICDH